jgi:squalene-hopene/tetraprenyl-beta-curcumene cyclase
MKAACIGLIALLLLTPGFAATAHAQAAAVEAAAETADRAAVIADGIEYLRTAGQAADGTFTIQAGPGLTALALTALLRNDVPLDDPMVVKGFKALEGFVKPDGGIYGNGRIKNYETCVAILAFTEANADNRYDKIIADANKFVRSLQYGVAAGQEDEANVWYGGVGYGGPERPDLSNTSYLIDALKAVDAPNDDEAIQRALVFVSRCQNLKSEYNETEFAGKVNDGGFFYVIPTEKVDPSEDESYTADGGLRSYGSMTYAGFKSLVYAGLTKEDPRVKAALEWIGKNYSVTENPGQGSAGLYYYYNTFGSALDAANLDAVVDAEGKSHDWRADLTAELAKQQNDDGSWANANRQWFENDKNLATSFALLALAHCDDEQK